ncbi:MAG: DUF2628 domain-containing protein [Beijerinckiaceae bacterium]|jgi:hypothetical protein|nr:DUF2628 domain-containing protein [Beijerinckiaceae bacterium]
MAFYTVLMPPATAGETQTDQFEKTVFLKDGFVVFAFLFTGLWLLSKRLWLAFGIFLLLWLALAFGGRAIGLHPLGLALAQALIGLFLGLEGHALLERKLIRKGWQPAGVVEGKDIGSVERRFFETMPMAARPGLPAPATGPLSGQAMAIPAQGNHGTVLGLFPDAQGRT